MSLTEQLNPQTTALVIVSGNSIYVWDYDKPQCIATRPQKVDTLELYENRLIDSGRCLGVRDTLEGRIILGETNAWNTLAVHDTVLFGSKYTKVREEYGIWDMRRMEKVRQRNGLTKILTGGPSLLDAGDYIYFSKEMFHIPLKDDGVYLTQEDLPVFPRGFQPYTAAFLQGSDLIAASYASLHKMKSTPYNGGKGYSKIFSLESDISKIYEEFSKIDREFGYADADRASLWEQFRQLFMKHAATLPEEFRRVYEHDEFDRKHFRAEILPLPFAESCRFYNRKFKRYQASFPEGNVEKGFYLNPILDHVSIFLLFQHYAQNKILAIARINDALVIGGKSNKLVIADEKLQERGDHILWKFSHPITAMKTIPIEVYNDGIKQRVLERIRQRAYYANIAQQIPLRRAA